MPRHPLAEVFGFPAGNMSPEAHRYRRRRLCPFNNKGPNCTKDKANDPLGVCSIYDGDEVTITCPIRFRQHWIIADDAAKFFFPHDPPCTSLTEVRLNDQDGRSAGNIDVVLVSYDDLGKVTDFGALEVQGVYISGNVRRPFEHYMGDPEQRSDMDWTRQSNYPRPDYLSSSRKRLAPQLMFKGGILKDWGKKQAVAIHRGFYRTLPTLLQVEPTDADIAWLIYELDYDAAEQFYNLKRVDTVYTKFETALTRISTADAGPIEDFIAVLQDKLDEKLENNPPDAPSLTDIIPS